MRVPKKNEKRQTQVLVSIAGPSKHVQMSKTLYQSYYLLGYSDIYIYIYIIYIIRLYYIDFKKESPYFWTIKVVIHHHLQPTNQPTNRFAMPRDHLVTPSMAGFGFHLHYLRDFCWSKTTHKLRKKWLVGGPKKKMWYRRFLFLNKIPICLKFLGPENMSQQ